MTEYKCAMCGRKIHDRSICRHCERLLHKSVSHSAKTPHGVKVMERTV